ncbi:hypothetical protein CHS0354_026071 [Potamilus streckersoni]|uniref:Uncharacterized protein n=1 Tax=Potamilus streckersoni TaxID=2493646 RepID=A0AAE0SFN9_9BIVA|nr:hypothetical protein CHS0354_026071 [Potamilus streckersoni]
MLQGCVPWYYRRPDCPTEEQFEKPTTPSFAKGSPQDPAVNNLRPSQHLRPVHHNAALHPEERDQFYEAPDQAISNISSTENLFLLKDFSVRVRDDGRGLIIGIGQQLLKFCCSHSLCVIYVRIIPKELHHATKVRPCINTGCACNPKTAFHQRDP